MQRRTKSISLGDILYSSNSFNAAFYAMSPEMQEKMIPELVITYGGHIVSKRMKKYLRQHPPKEHWHVSPDGEVIDLFQGALTTIIEMDPFEFMEKIAFLLDNRTPEYPRQWENFCKELPRPELPYSEMSAIGSLIQALPASCALHLANSSAVRYAQLYSLPDTVEVCCNRGTSGIEGSLSTAIGYAAASKKLNFVVIGDLSFFYDMNALRIKHIGNNIRILLLNNQGGGEFYYNGSYIDEASDLHTCARHHTKAEGWVKENNFVYLSAHNKEEFATALKVFMEEKTDKSIFLEVFTEMKHDSDVVHDFYAIGKPEPVSPFKQKVKEAAKFILPKSLINVIKK